MKLSIPESGSKSSHRVCLKCFWRGRILILILSRWISFPDLNVTGIEEADGSTEVPESRKQSTNEEAVLYNDTKYITTRSNSFPDQRTKTVLFPYLNKVCLSSCLYQTESSQCFLFTLIVSIRRDFMR